MVTIARTLLQVVTETHSVLSLCVQNSLKNNNNNSNIQLLSNDKDVFQYMTLSLRLLLSLQSTVHNTEVDHAAQELKEWTISSKDDIERTIHPLVVDLLHKL